MVASEGDAGATSGRASAQEAADIGVKDAAMITVMGLYPDGTIQGATFWMPADRIAAGVELSIGVDVGGGGVIWQIPAGKFEPEGFVPVTSGSIELTEAGTEPGAVIAGRLYAGFEGATAQVGEGEAYGTESGSLEVRFETAWGTNQSVDPSPRVARLPIWHSTISRNPPRVSLPSPVTLGRMSGFYCPMWKIRPPLPSSARRKTAP